MRILGSPSLRPLRAAAQVPTMPGWQSELGPWAHGKMERAYTTKMSLTFTCVPWGMHSHIYYTHTTTIVLKGTPASGQQGSEEGQSMGPAPHESCLLPSPHPYHPHASLQAGTGITRIITPGTAASLASTLLSGVKGITTASLAHCRARLP